MKYGETFHDHHTVIDHIGVFDLFIMLLIKFGLPSGNLLGKSCPLSWPFVYIASCPFVISVISRFGFEGGVWFLIARVPVHFLLVNFCVLKCFLIHRTLLFNQCI